MGCDDQSCPDHVNFSDLSLSLSKGDTTLNAKVHEKDVSQRSWLDVVIRPTQTTTTTPRVYVKALLLLPTSPTT